MNRKRPFKIKFMYFKSTGKFYSDAVWEVEAGNCADPGSPPICYMHDVKEWLEQIRDSSLEEKNYVPGLCSRGRDFYVVIDCDDGFPMLLMPKGEE